MPTGGGTGEASGGKARLIDKLSAERGSRILSIKDQKLPGGEELKNPHLSQAGYDAQVAKYGRDVVEAHERAMYENGQALSDAEVRKYLSHR